MSKPYIVKDFVQGSKEWHKYRNERIGASDAPSILGHGYVTPYELWCEKQGITKREQSSNMTFGIEKEPEIRRFVNNKLNCEFKPCTIESIENPWQLASLDGLSQNGNLAIEIKCANAIDHDSAKRHKVPLKYQAQLQHQMLVLGLEFVFYVSYHFDDIRIFPVEREDTTELFNKEKEFYGYMQDFIAPPLIQKDYIKRIDKDFELAVKDYLFVDEQLNYLTQKKKNSRENLLNLCNNQNSEGFGVRISKVYSKGRIDYSEISEIQNIDLEKHRKKTIESWRIYGT